MYQDVQKLSCLLKNETDKHTDTTENLTVPLAGGKIVTRHFVNYNMYLSGQCCLGQIAAVCLHVCNALEATLSQFIAYNEVKSSITRLREIWVCSANKPLYDD